MQRHRCRRSVAACGWSSRKLRDEDRGRRSAVAAFPQRSSRRKLFPTMRSPPRNRRCSLASVSKSSVLEVLRRTTTRQTASRSSAPSKGPLGRRAPLAIADSRPKSRVSSVTIRLVSLNSIVRSTIAVVCSAAIGMLANQATRVSGPSRWQFHSSPKSPSDASNSLISAAACALSCARA